jgi:hypothetical protein
VLDAKKIDAAVNAVEAFKSRVDRYADAEEQEPKSRSKETTHNKETRQSKDGEKHVVETKQTSEPQQDDPPDPEAKAQSGESKAAVNALKTKMAQDKKNEKYEDSQMKPDTNLDHAKMERMVNTTEKLMGRMDAYMDRAKADALDMSPILGKAYSEGATAAKEKKKASDNPYPKDSAASRYWMNGFKHGGGRSDDYGHPVAAGFRTQEQEPRSDDTTTKEEIHHTIDKREKDDEPDESDAKGGDNPRKDSKK